MKRFTICWLIGHDWDVTCEGQQRQCRNCLVIHERRKWWDSGKVYWQELRSDGWTDF